MREYPAEYDAFAYFKPIYDREGKFADYVLIGCSPNFSEIIGLKRGGLIGESASTLVVEQDTSLFDLKEIYFRMIPGVKRRFVKYLSFLGRTCLISILSGEDDFLLLTISDIQFSEQERGEFREIELQQDPVSLAEGAFLKQNRFLDQLTGIYNRDFFEEVLIKLDSREQLPLSIVLGDINGLKLINDVFGHLSGDELLKKAAQILQAALRPGDVVCRIGGDEFVLILPRTSERNARLLVRGIEKLCQLDPLQFAPLSISFGIAAKVKNSEKIKEVLRRADDRMYYNKIKESREYKAQVIAGLKNRLEVVCCETEQHYANLKGLSSKFAELLNLSAEEKERLLLLCDYHDIGKIAVAKELLFKKEQLTAEEKRMIRRHSEVGYRIVGGIYELYPINELVLGHHERWDGTGYPSRIKGEEIPLLSRIFAVVEAYEAMVSHRPYRDKLSKQEAINELQSEAGKQFDPELVWLFVEMINREEDVAI